jgi:Pyruvate/2-oxoacid:ferredoxin oxidoreductase gamma subunit
MLGAFASATGFFPVAEMTGELRTWFGSKLSKEVVEANVRAMERGAAQIVEG